jgi:FAD/FMN-containing dehydrogenase
MLDLQSRFLEVQLAQDAVHDLATATNRPAITNSAWPIGPTSYGANHERLGRIKADYDPENVFRPGQNIRPAA